jgi:putative transposase
MKINKTYKIEIKPNNKQETLLYKSCGTARFAYNWGLKYKIDLYEKEKKFVSAIDLHKILCSIKEKEFPWMYEVSKCSPQEALRDLDSAFKKFFTEKKGFPKFKKKGKDKDSFRINSKPSFKQVNNVLKINIPKIGFINLTENDYLSINKVKFNCYTVSRDGNKWFISFNVEQEIKNPKQIKSKKNIVGIDLGIKTLVTCSDGIIFENNKFLKKSLKKLKRLHKQLSRKKKESKNREKSKNKLRKIYYKVSCQRKDTIHKMTSKLVKTKPKYIVIEDLSIKNMMNNHILAQLIYDASFGEIKRQLEYKIKWYGGKLIVVDRFFPSSKLCSECNNKKEDLSLKDRIYKCDNCGLEIDRDLNASINLKNEGIKILNTDSSSEIKVYRDSNKNR